MPRLILTLVTILLLATIGAFAISAQTIHIVQPGETLFRVALQNGRTVDEIAMANGLAPPYLIHAGNQLIIPDANAPAAAPQESPAPAQASTSAYTVQPGESLSMIAARFGTTYLELARMNGISDPNVLNVGQVLQVPAPPAPPPATVTEPAQEAQPTYGTYLVRGGDTLSSIAAQFGTTYLELARLNGIINPDALSVGQILRVPGAPPPPEPPPPAPAESTAPTQTEVTPPSTTNVSGFELGGQALSFSFPSQMHHSRMTWVKRQVKWHGEPAGRLPAHD